MRVLSGTQPSRILRLVICPAIFAAACSILAGCGSQMGDKSTRALMEEIQSPEYRMNEERQMPLHIAAEDGKAKEVVQLLKQGADVDPRDRWDRTPLHLAAERGHVGIVRELLASGANVNAQTKLGENPLFFALRYWQGDEDGPTGKTHWTELVNTLLDAGARFNLVSSTRLTPLHLAASAKAGNPEVVQRFINGGANVNATEEGGDTPLHFAANSGKIENVRVLLAAGANVHARGRGDCTPLHSATWHREASATLVRLFVEAGADVNAKDDNGETPLHQISPAGQSDWAAELLKAGARINERSNEGQTPLHKAAAAGRADMAALLLDAGAEVNAADNDGRTPLDLAAMPHPFASKANVNACIALLKKRGGRPGSNQNDK